jgi:hypothetical protein
MGCVIRERRLDRAPLNVLRIVCLGNFAFVSPATGAFAAITIKVLGAAHSTSLTTPLTTTALTSAKTGGLNDLSDSLQVDPLITATATSSLFSVDALAAAPVNSFAFAQATAGTERLFSPVVDSGGRIGLDFIGGTGESYYSDATAALFNVTANQYLWNFGWTCCSFDGNVPFAVNDVPGAVDSVIDASRPDRKPGVPAKSSDDDLRQ